MKGIAVCRLSYLVVVERDDIEGVDQRQSKVREKGRHIEYRQFVALMAHFDAVHAEEFEVKQNKIRRGYFIQHQRSDQQNNARCDRNGVEIVIEEESKKTRNIPIICDHEEENNHAHNHREDN